MLLVVARNLAENAIRYAGPGTTFTLTAEREPDGVGRPLGPRRRDGRRRVGAAAALRAFLPRRPRAGIAGNRARARDREAHRDPGGRDRRGARWPRPGARGPLRLRVSAVARTPDFHRMFTRRPPGGRNPPGRLGAMNMRALAALAASTAARRSAGERLRRRRVRRRCHHRRRVEHGRAVRDESCRRLQGRGGRGRHGRYLGHRRRVRALLRRRDRPLQRIAADRRGRAGVVRRGRRRVPGVPRRDGRAHERRQQARTTGRRA